VTHRSTTLEAAGQPLALLEADDVVAGLVEQDVPTDATAPANADVPSGVVVAAGPALRCGPALTSTHASR
jgi:hypothetical protein